MPTGQKHLVECTCVLSQFKAVKPPVYHKFVVFSVIDDNDAVEEKFVQCNNCGIIHKVTDIGKSEIMYGNEHMNSLVNIDDIKLSLPEKYVKLLERYDLPLSSWEEVEFLVTNKQWGSTVVLTSDVLKDGVKQGKILVILGENLMKIESYKRSEVFSAGE